MGIMLYILLSGAYPFSFRNIENDIIRTPVLFLGPTWAGISHEAKNLIMQMLEKDQFSRIKAKEALDHAWFKKFPPKKVDIETEDKVQLDHEIVQNMIKYRGMSKVRMTALRILVTMMNKKDVEPLRRLFLEIDHDRTGFITSHELQDAMEKSNYNFSQDEINEIVREVDIH